MPTSAALETEFFRLTLPHLLPTLGSLQRRKKKEKISHTRCVHT